MSLLTGVNRMKRAVYLTVVIIPVMLLFVSSVYGGWKNIIVTNQIKATEYISQLQKGANPNKLSRPAVRRVDKASAKAANREVKEAMDEAENLARAGKHHLIKTPEFRAIASDEMYQQLQKKSLNNR